MGLLRRLRCHLTIILDPYNRLDRGNTETRNVLITSRINYRVTMTLLSSASVLFLTFGVTRLNNGPFRTDMTVRRQDIMFVTGVLSRLNYGCDLRRVLVTFRRTGLLATTRSVMYRRRANLLANCGRPFTLIILGNSARAINVQVKDRCGINVSLAYLASDRIRYNELLQVEQRGHQGVSTGRDLLLGGDGVLGSRLYRTT